MAAVLISEKLNSIYKALPQEWPLITLGGAVCFVTARYVIYVVKCREVKSKIADRRKRSEDGIEKLRAELMRDDINTAITQLSFEELQSNLQNGRLSAQDVVKAYQAKTCVDSFDTLETMFQEESSVAILVNDSVNAITDVIPSALASAVALDLKNPNERGPLHGIPISVKESVGLKNEDCTAGLAKLIDNPLPDDSVLVKVLKGCGAIPFVRTNIPQAMRSFATDNPIYGLTVNPINNGRSPGGSSGGEGSIVGGAGSILGVGSDIGGSIRIPAAYCGIPGLKPTNNRISGVGNFGYGTRIGGQKLVPPAYGPMGRDVNSLVQFMQCILGPTMFKLDPLTPPIPFRNEMYTDTKPLHIGYYTYDQCTKCVPAVVRAVHEAKSTLEALGHTFVEFSPPDVAYAMEELLYPAFFADECEGYRDLVKHDNTCDILYDWVRLCQYPYIVRWLMGKWKDWTSNDPQNANLLKRPPIRSVSGWWKRNLDSNAYQAKFFKQWKAKDLDLVICPCMPSVALKNGTDRKLLVTIDYTALYNVVNYPAGTVPVTKVTKDDVIKVRDPRHYSPTTKMEKLMMEDFTEDAEGMPVGIQVVGLPYKEEMVLRVMSELESSSK